MRYRARLLTDRLCKLVERFPVVVVSGARQVGKTTLLRHTFKKWQLVTFDSAVDVGNARKDPDLFLDNHPTPLILDEIQYAPELVASIKRRVDRTRKPGQFILTGSQQWSVLKTASESLAGRAVFLDLEGFSFAEIEGTVPGSSWLSKYLDKPEKFVKTAHAQSARRASIYEMLWRGFLPEAIELDSDLLPDFHRAYLRTYIERDARLLADVADWQQFGQFARLAAASTAQEVNHSQFGREIGVTPQTARRWLTILNATFQWHEVPAFHGNTIKRLSSKPKGYFADTGLACHLHYVSSPTTLAGHPMSGALFETAIVAEIRKLASVLVTPPVLQHWRSHGGAEVDLLLERDNRLYPIEIKLTTKPSSGSARGIVALRETYPRRDIAPGLVICAIESSMKLNANDLAMPWNVT